jgi:flavin reductase (DIM6/NTAB) family NADH-FMN oxidoreductase RutF
MTVRQGEAETGMLASWVQQCSFDPPRVSVAIQPQREVNNYLQPGHVFVLNVLGTTSKHLITHFAKGFSLNEPAFQGLNVQRDADSPPILGDALAYLRCTVVERFTAGDHDLVIGEVKAGAVQGEGEPRIHVRKNGFNY